MKRLVLLSAFASLLFIAAAPATRVFAQETDIEQMVENAKDPSDYEAIAAYYAKKGDEAQQQFEWHEALLKTYKQNPRLSTMQMHCDRLVQIYKDEAKENKVMADLYRQKAKGAQ